MWTRFTVQIHKYWTSSILESTLDPDLYAVTMESFLVVLLSSSCPSFCLSKYLIRAALKVESEV